MNHNLCLVDCLARSRYWLYKESLKDSVSSQAIVIHILKLQLRKLQSPWNRVHSDSRPGHNLRLDNISCSYQRNSGN
jgi:hypothetical protein